MLKKVLMFVTVIPLLLGVFGVTSMTHAQSAGNAFELIPEVKDKGYGAKVEELTQPGVKFWEKYNEHGDSYNKGKRDLGAAMASGIITWDTILTLLTQVIKFIANASLVVGSAMFIYAGYLYVTAVYSGDGQTSKANEAVKDAVIGVVLVIFSYAIQKIVVQAFLS